MVRFFTANPGFRSRIAHHTDFPDYRDAGIRGVEVKTQSYALDESDKQALEEYIAHRCKQPHFANARSIRNAPDRARLRQANRLFETQSGPLDARALSTITAADIRPSRDFRGGLDADRPQKETP